MKQKKTMAWPTSLWIKAIRDSIALASRQIKRTFLASIFNTDLWKKSHLMQIFSKVSILQNLVTTSMTIPLFSDNKETRTSTSLGKTDSQPIDLNLSTLKIWMFNLADPFWLHPIQAMLHHSVTCLPSTRNKMSMFASRVLNLEIKKSYFWIILNETNGYRNIHI